MFSLPSLGGDWTNFSADAARQKTMQAMRTAVTRSSDMVEAPPENNPGDTRTAYTVLSTQHRVQAGRRPIAANELSDDVVHDTAVHIGQPEVAAAVVICQSLVID